MRNTVNRPSGSWSSKQETELQELLRNNIVDYKNRNPDYLFQITEEHFPAFITPGTQGRNAAIQRMRGKFIKYETDLGLRGARCRYRYGMVSCFCNRGIL
jgi:hypothetical protein